MRVYGGTLKMMWGRRGSLKFKKVLEKWYFFFNQLRGLVACVHVALQAAAPAALRVGAAAGVAGQARAAAASALASGQLWCGAAPRFWSQFPAAPTYYTLA